MSLPPVPPAPEALYATASLARQLFEARRADEPDPWCHPGVVMDQEDGLPRLARSGESGTLPTECLGPCDDEEAALPRVDAYRLGVVLHRALTGELPLRASNPVEWRLTHRHDTPRAPSEIDPGLPPALDRLAAVMLSKSAQDRPESLLALAEGLEQHAASLKAHPTQRPSRRLTDLVLGPPRGGHCGAEVEPLPWALVALGLVIALGTIVRTLAPDPAPPVAQVQASAPALEATSPAVAVAVAVPPEPVEAKPVVEPVEQVAKPAPPAPRARPTRPVQRAVVSVPEPVRDHLSEDLTQLLERADALLARKRYLAPRGQNALALYQEVLALDPGHPVALARIELIRETHRELASTHARSGDLERAHDVLFALDQAMPGDPGVAAKLISLEAQIAAARRPGWVKLEVRPWGDVFVDGRYVDQTPMDAIQLDAGSHHIEVRGENGRSRAIDVRVEGGKTLEVAVDLSRRNPS